MMMMILDVLKNNNNNFSLFLEFNELGTIHCIHLEFGL